MANAPPLPPIVNGPVYTTSKQVNVTSLLPNVKVWVYNDAASTHVVGTATTSAGGGSIWVPLTATLNAGQEITAKQEYQGHNPKILVSGQSPASTLPVPVVRPPEPLPAPIFASGLCTCMDWIYVDGLIAGATLTVKMGATILVSAAEVTQSPQWFQLAAATIIEDAVLEAQQNIGALKSSITTSNPIPVAPPLGAPDVAPPTPLACQTNLNFSDMQPGADLKIINGSNEYAATSPSSSYNLYDLAPPLLAGSSTAQQYFTRCKQEEAPTTTFTVKPDAPAFPKVSYAPCSDVTLLNVFGVVGGEVLTLEASYSTTSGPQVQPLGSCGVSGPGPVPLPKGWYPSAAVGPVTLRIGALLCDKGLPSPGYTAVPVKEPPGPYPPPTVQKPLYDCASSVFVDGANPGCLIQVFAQGPPAIPRSNPVVATTAKFPIKLFWPLITNEEIYVKQLGCGASLPPAPPVRVQPSPKLSVPAVVGSYVLTSATSVLAKDVVPGAQVTLFVNNHARSAPVDSIEAEAGPPTGTPPLIEARLPVGVPALVVGDVLTAGQALCGLNKVPSDQGGVKVQAPVPPPSGPGEPGGGLGSNNNYFMFQPTASGCANLINVSVKIQVTEEIVWESTGAAPPGCPAAPPTGTPGLSFQLNCYSPPPTSSNPKYPAWQQYIINLWGTQLLGAINTWHTFTDVVIFPGNEYTTPLGPGVPSTGSLPVGVYEIALGNDSSGNVNTVAWIVNGVKYTPSPPTIPALLTANGLSANDVAPIIAFTLNLVGPVNGESAVLTSGAGIITYSASSALTVTNQEPAKCVEDITGFTCERATSSYGQLPANPGNPFSQTFAVSAITPLFRSMRGRPLVRG